MMQMPGTSFNVTAKNWLRAALLGACTLALLPHGTAAQGLVSRHRGCSRPQLP
ncbi:hypothetical protein EIO_1681 [Ketogulonicigenium vulgare Y25]|uniref:hypothetical protein n=1 Tax=Ketogulonicigenium vulgare TaxID=92945 RepID=UPI0001E67ED8|nr:hypothetical protein [Ketogulonicigenium vulgare]ADO42804.1 hypothetical protein EIO_1681 [Ketogulonicigenium vulgare Y25]